MTQPVTGKVLRIDRRSGEVTTYARGLPKQNPDIGVGGPTDIIFRNGVGYALVTLVSSDVGGSDVDGIYRLGGPHHATPIADIGAFAIAHPPHTDFFIPSGVQYAMEKHGRGFLVTDGHHNRVYQVQLNGRIHVARAFGDIVPTGLENWHGNLFMSEAGPVPHRAWTGKVVRIGPRAVKIRARGAPLLTDVEHGTSHGLYAVSQGDFPDGEPPGTPAAPDTGSLVRATQSGRFVTIVHPVDRPTALEIVGSKAYIVGLGGDVVEVDHLG